MPKSRKPKFVAPFLHVHLENEGERILSVTAQNPTMITSSHFAALTTLHPDARPYAVAITLIEIAASLVKADEDVTDLLEQAVVRLVLHETPWFELKPKPADWPF